MTSFSARAAAFVKFWLFSLVIAMALLGPGLASAEGFRPFDRIVVFGDSLSDSGNLYALGPLFGLDAPGSPSNNWSMNTPEELVTLVPGQAYISRRLSNGPTWAELLGSALGLSANVRPVFADPADLRRFNFAVAGATAANPRNFPAGNPLHLGGQVDAFLARAFALNGTGTTSDTLYVIAIGGNDVRAVGDFGPQILGDTLAALEQAIRRLNQVGGKNFLIWNIPDLGATPAFRRIENGVPLLGVPPSPGTVEGVRALIAGYNAGLKARLHVLSTAPELDGGLPGTEFIPFDTFGTLTEVRRHPRRYGLTNVDDACIRIMPFFAAASACAQPDRHLFWDGIHPTRAGHAILAFFVGKDLVKALLQDH
jgi:outer membrane lipase/esterase